MKQSIFYQAASTIISGLVLSIFGFIFLQIKPAELADNIHVEYYNTSINKFMLSDIIKSVDKNINFDDMKTQAQFYSIFGYIDNINMSIFSIDNSTSREISDMSITIGKHLRAYLMDNRGIEPINSDKDSIHTSVLPRSTKNLIILSIYKSYEPDERFIVNGKEVSIIPLRDNVSQFPDYTILSIFQKYSIIIILLSIIGISTVFVILTGLILFLWTKDMPDYQIKNSNNWVLSRDIAIMNLIKRDSPERFSQIVRKAEKYFAKWNGEGRGEADSEQGGT